MFANGMTALRSRVRSSYLGFLMAKRGKNVTSPKGFDVSAFFAAIEARRREQDLSWPSLAKAVWDQSRVLNERRNDHPISPATLRKIGQRKIGQRCDISCQHALFLLRWLGVPPETFIAAPKPGTAGVALPLADEAHRLRWDLPKLYDALNAGRTKRGSTWEQVAERLHCTANQLTHLRIAKFAVSMRLAMRITQALRYPAADFVYVAEW